MKIRMVVVEGSRKGMTFEYDTHDSLVVGRGEGCGLQLVSDPAISRHHVILEFRPPRCFLKNLGRNGTKVNGRPAPEAMIGDGDTIELGRTRLAVAIEGEARIEEAAETVRPCIKCGKLVPVRDDEPETGSLEGSLCSDCRSATRVQRGKLDRYVMDHELGKGGYARVYLAHDGSADGRTVVIKVLEPQFSSSRISHDEILARFQREGSLGLALKHPNIVETYEMLSVGTSLVLAMEYMAGGDLASKVRKAGAPLPVPEACRYLLQALEGLAYAHGKKIIHRDVKPGNILLTADGAGATAKIGDLGLAKELDDAAAQALTLPGLPQGSAAFMPPEQIHSMSKVGPAGDVFSAGATLYWLLANDIIYAPEYRNQGPIPMVLEGEIRPLPEVNPAVPEKLWSIVQKALSRSADDRYADASRFAKALEKVAPA